MTRGSGGAVAALALCTAQEWGPCEAKPDFSRQVRNMDFYMKAPDLSMLAAHSKMSKNVI